MNRVDSLNPSGHFEDVLTQCCYYANTLEDLFDTFYQEQDPEDMPARRLHDLAAGIRNNATDLEYYAGRLIWLAQDVMNTLDPENEFSD